MKGIYAICLLFYTILSFGQAIELDQYRYELTDLSSRKIDVNQVYKKMDRELIKLGQSICANRALMWVYDFKKDYDIDAGKIFLFYTNKTGNTGRKTWWYHVSPIVADKGEVIVMDAGFTNSFNQPLKVNEWITHFIGGTNCKEITHTDTKLLQMMFEGHVFPEQYEGNQYDCYYAKTPAGYWTPASVAMNALGIDMNGNQVHFERNEIEKSEVYSACLEAVTTPVGRMLRTGKNKCRKFLE